MHDHGPSNEVHNQLLLKKTNKAVLAIDIRSSKRYYTCCTLLTRRSASVLQVGVSYG